MTRKEKIEWLKRIERGENVANDIVDYDELHKSFLATVPTEILKKGVETNDLSEIHLLFNEYVKNFKNE